MRNDVIVHKSRQRVERVRLLLEELRKDDHPKQAAMAEKLLAIMLRAQDVLQESRELLYPLEKRRETHGAFAKWAEVRTFACKSCGFEAVVHDDGPERHAIDYKLDWSKLQCIDAGTRSDRGDWRPLNCPYFRHSLALFVDEQDRLSIQLSHLGARLP